MRAVIVSKPSSPIRLNKQKTKLCTVSTLQLINNKNDAYELYKQEHNQNVRTRFSTYIKLII